MSLREPFAGNRAAQTRADLAASSSKQAASTPAPAGSHLAQPWEHVNVRHPVSPRLAEGIVDKIAALPEREATKSRDYGRGYAQAVRDVLALLAEEREGVSPV